MSIKIGDINLNSQVILAPMSGVTDLPYRTLVKKLGAELVVSEMVASRAMIAKCHKSMQKSAIIPDDTFGSCVQLAGCDPDYMAKSAKIAEDNGAKIIDINFGCPVKKVVNGYAGSALMREEELAKKILISTVKAVKVPVTLKMRMGWDENSKNAGKFAKMAEDVGIKMITVHCRTRSQFYSGKADWGFLKSITSDSKIPVIVNGDIITHEDAKNALLESGANGVMVGRGAYGRPWAISQLSHFLKYGELPEEPPVSRKLEIIMEHYDSMIEYYGKDVGVKMARKHLGWYSAKVPSSSEFRAKINQMSDHLETRKVVEEFFSELQ